MPYRQLNVPENGVLDLYQSELTARDYQADPAQQAAVKRLQQLYSELLAFKVARQRTYRRWFSSPPASPRSVYFWGGVGRGKSFLMDCFFAAVPYQRKRRVHFHAFMQEIHLHLRALRHESDPLKQVASQVARETRLLCFDEFHISDIADAMILGRLLEALLGHGVIFVMTSNYPPDGLYPNGLQRINFLPTIELIKRQFDVLEVDDGTDYRLKTLSHLDIYLSPADELAQQRLHQSFFELAGQAPQSGALTVLGREIAYEGQAPGVIWFSFTALCTGPRSQNDYLEIAQSYHTVLISNIPQMSERMAAEARRFTWLIDVLYDFKVNVLISAETEAAELYLSGPHANEFSRTVSRLIEMRSHDYLAEAHRAA